MPISLPIREPEDSLAGWAVNPSPEWQMYGDAIEDLGAMRWVMPEGWSMDESDRLPAVRLSEDPQRLRLALARDAARVRACLARQLIRWATAQGITLRLGPDKFSPAVLAESPDGVLPARLTRAVRVLNGDLVQELRPSRRRTRA